MRRTASEMLNELEMRIARLERSAGSAFDGLHDIYRPKKQVKLVNTAVGKMRIEFSNFTVRVQEDKDKSINLSFDLNSNTKVDENKLSSALKEIDQILSKLK